MRTRERERERSDGEGATDSRWCPYSFRHSLRQSGTSKGIDDPNQLNRLNLERAEEAEEAEEEEEEEESPAFRAEIVD
jgi:hypothetical protein